MTRRKETIPHTSDEIQHIKEDLDSLRSNVVALTRAVRHEVKAEAVSGLELVKQLGRDGVSRVEEQVKIRPGKSMLAAFAAGLALSMMARR